MPKQSSRTEQPGRIGLRRARTRTSLLKAAYELMSAKGVDETAIQEITETADVGFGTFYNYFDSKDGLATSVLDCIINTLGQRFDLANERQGLGEAARLIMPTSMRLCAREMMTNAIWHWWLQRPDLMVQRMRVVFAPFALRDLRRAIAAGQYHVIDGDLEMAWSMLIWLLAGTIKEIVEGGASPKADEIMCESMLRMMGVEIAAARRMARQPLPTLPALAIDFTFVASDAAGDV